jgi:mono/diheme cytochrome c family protein
MSHIYPKDKAVYLLAGTMGFLLNLTGCGGGGGDAAQVDDVIDDVIVEEFVTISGKITNLNDAGEPDVQVEGVYTTPGGTLNPTENTDSNGNFSLSVLKNDPVFLQATKSGFVTLNSQKAALNTNVTGLDIGLPTESQAQDVIDIAFTTMPVLQNHAWLVVDIEDSNGDGVSGQTISISNATAADMVYTECDGTDGGATSTTGPCPSGRSSPMYLAYFNASSDATVTVGSETQIAPIRMGEITALEYEVASAPVGSVSAGRAKYDADCASCHAAGSYDMTTSNGGNDLLGKSNLLITDISSYSPGKKAAVADLSSQEILDLTAFLESL